MITKMFYSSVAIPQNGIALTNKYVLDKDTNGYFYFIGKEKVYQDIELIKTLFSPIDNMEWDDVLKPTVKKSINKTTRKKDEKPILNIDIT